MQPLTPLRLTQGVGDVLFGTLHCERRLAGAVVQVEKPEGNHKITDITLQGSAAECCTAVLQVLHHASAAYSQNNDLSSGNFAQPAWQFTHKDQQEVLSTTQLTGLPLDMFAPDAPCMHLPSSCFLTLPLAVQCCQLLAQGQVQQSATSGTAEEYENKDGDVLMADEDVEQLVASLQAARHASSEWENMGGLSSISMLLFGHQGTAEQEPSPMDFAITKPGAVRLYVVLDTSVLLSHWSFIQALYRNLGQYGAVQPNQASSLAPAVQLLLVVPWAVLVELDKLKERSVLRIPGGKKDVVPLARRAIKGLAGMLSKDRWLQYQSETDALKANKELGSKGKKALNDDSIIYCGMDVQRRVWEAHLQGNLEASKSGAVLLTKDNNMCLKAQANGLKAMSPNQFPAAQPHLHKRLLAISSETSPVRHTPTPDASPPPPPQPLSDLCPHPSQGNITLPTTLSHSLADIGQPSGIPAPIAKKHDPHPHITTNSSNEFLHPANTSTQLGKLQQPEQSASFLQDPQQLWRADPHLPQQEQHHQQQQLSQQLQQRQPESEDMAVGSFKLQGAPMLPSGLVTGSHGYPRAPSSTPAHLQPSTSATGQQQQSDSGPGLGLGLGLHYGLQYDFTEMDGSMQHQQGGFPGNLLPTQFSTGRRLTSSTSLRDHRATSGQGLHSTGSNTSALGALTTSNSSGTDNAQELSERVWGVLVEGLQPFMQWELQSGIGDFWEQAILVAPPWDVADMMAVMKKDMSGTLHSNAELSRCHSRLAAAVKARERSTSLSLAADLASNVSSVLLMLPLPAKTDKVAHVKSGAVTGLEARLALQKGREEAQHLFKLASTALQQQQPRSASFPSKGRPTPIGPTPSIAQASGAAGIMGQKRSPLPFSDSLMSHSSAMLDPVFSGLPLRHARQPTSLGQPQAPSALLSNPAPLANIWQQHTIQQDTIPASFSGPISRAESAVSSYLPQQQNSTGWSGSVQVPMPQSAHQGDNGNLHDSLERHYSGNGRDLLQSAQGLLQIFGKCAAEHLSRCKVQLQQHPADAQAVQQATNIIADAAKLLLHAIAIVHASEPPQRQVEVVKQCAQNMLLMVFWVMDQQQAPPNPKPSLVKELCIFFNDPESAQAAANVAQHLQHMAQSVMGR